MRSSGKFWKILLPTLLLCAAVVCVAVHPDFSVQTLLAHTPENPVLAIGVLLLLYALKGATLIFPLSVLQIVVGLLFPTGLALLVNLAGLALVLTVPYGMGCGLGIRAVDRLMQRYPKFGSLVDRQQNNSFFLSLFLRLIGELPGDAVTMYLGATGIPYLHNLTGGILGMLPRMILTTILGASIQEPSSPVFWISITLRLLLSAVSFGVYYLYQKRAHGGHADAEAG